MYRTKKPSEADWFVRTCQLKHINKGTPTIYLTSVSCFSSKHLRKFNLSKQTASCFVMNFPSKEFPVMTIHFLWYLALNSFLVFDWGCAFHNATPLFLIIPQWPIHLAWNTFLRYLLNQIACCAQPYWGFLWYSFYFSLRENIIPHLASFIF